MMRRRKTAIFLQVSMSAFSARQLKLAKGPVFFAALGAGCQWVDPSS
jgi:hypothetical protein